MPQAKEGGPGHCGERSSHFSAQGIVALASRLPSTLHGQRGIPRLAGSHRAIDEGEAMTTPRDGLAALTPACHRAHRSRWLGRVSYWFLQRRGWSLEGAVPPDARLVLVVGPHTSNWDFAIGVLFMLALDLRVHFIAKHSLFVGPAGWLLRRLGGIAIDRGRPDGFVSQTAATMARSDQMLLAITPEGTRSRVDRLKTGFSRIAATVPCHFLPVLLDFDSRTVRLLPPLQASDPEQDAATVRALFATAGPKNPANF